jgi:cleavage stimulation factor subunit 3
MDPELAFLESQKEYDPAGDYSSATAPEAAPAESVPADEDEEEYDPSAVILPSRAEQKAPSEQSPSIPPSATNTPTPGAEGLRPQPAAAAPSKQPRTVGGFVVESEDEDEVTDTNPQAGAASLNAYGTSHSPQRTISQSPNNTLAPSNETVHSAQDQGQPDVAPFVSVASNDAASVQSPAVPAQGTPVANLTMTGGSGQLNTASARPSTVPSTPVTNLPKQRLPQDRVGMLEDRIAEDPRGDSEAWLSLIEEHRRRHKIDEARAVYERFFKLFPTSVSSIGHAIRHLLTQSRLSNGSSISIWRQAWMNSAGWNKYSGAASCLTLT